MKVLRCLCLVTGVFFLSASSNAQSVDDIKKALTPPPMNFVDYGLQPRSNEKGRYHRRAGQGRPTFDRSVHSFRFRLDQLKPDAIIILRRLVTPLGILALPIAGFASPVILIPRALPSTTKNCPNVARKRCETIWSSSTTWMPIVLMPLDMGLPSQPTDASGR